MVRLHYRYEVVVRIKKSVDEKSVDLDQLASLETYTVFKKGCSFEKAMHTVAH